MILKLEAWNGGGGGGGGGSHHKNGRRKDLEKVLNGKFDNTRLAGKPRTRWDALQISGIGG